MHDRYDYLDELHTVFYINTDLECAVAHELDPAMPHIILIVHDATYHNEPYVLTGKDGALSFEEIQEFIDLSIVRSVPEWSRRAYFTLHKLNANAIVYVQKSHDDEKDLAF